MLVFFRLLFAKRYNCVMLVEQVQVDLNGNSPSDRAKGG
jgi:hypothetical protein